jgi:hypothetical protein
LNAKIRRLVRYAACDRCTRPKGSGAVAAARSEEKDAIGRFGASEKVAVVREAGNVRMVVEAGRKPKERCKCVPCPNEIAECILQFGCEVLKFLGPGWRPFCLFDAA